MGKLVLVARPDDEVQVVSRTLPLRLDNAGSTYLIVGRLGGISHVIAL